MIASFPLHQHPLQRNLAFITGFLKGPALLVLGIIYIGVGLLVPHTVPQHQSLTTPLQHHQHQQKGTPSTKKSFPMPPVSVPDAPTSLSLGLTSDTPYCTQATRDPLIRLAWQDAWNEETNNGLTFPTFFVRQIRQESGFCQYDQYGHILGSDAGALGVAQFEPGTAASHGVTLSDPASALLGAVRLMLQYIHKYNDYGKALAAYNAGEGKMDQCTTTDDWYTCLPSETQHYITNIEG